MSHWSNEKIARTLLEKGVINDTQYEESMSVHRNTGQKITKIIANRYNTESLKINTVLAGEGCNDLDSYIIENPLLDKFKEENVRKHVVMPLFTKGSQIYVSMANPSDFEAQQMVGFASGLTQIRNIPGNPLDIKRMIDKFYGRYGAIMEAMKEVNSRKTGTEMEDKLRSAPSPGLTDAPIVKLVDEYINRALSENASDIHFEPQEDGLHIRMRIDGKLQGIEMIPSTLIGPLTSRIKIMSQMKIDLRMIPQDGRFSKIIGGDDIDFRVSTFPGIFGESIVLRILKRKMRIPISDLGLSSKALDDFHKVLNQEKGIFLVTGPTGCGKTTTLVSILNEIKDPTKKILTLENPVEYQIDGSVQGQIHPQAGFTFSKGLRSIMRHDPNIIMVAEIRDPETANIAIEAGLTGHFVLSTLHTNNAPSTIIRLLEMGVEPYILASSLLGVLAQRLVRKICEHCREPFTPPGIVLKSLGLKEIPKNLQLFRGTGCDKCRHTGYSGRMGIFELMLVSEKMRQMIVARAPSAEVEIEAKKRGMRSLREDGIRKALQGFTSLEEIISVTQETSVD
ncbi:type II/IV secretion system protein [bacterium]|nr:type II/IV secretion system protein [candidate division CSSED10-310 bacterium]